MKAKKIMSAFLLSVVGLSLSGCFGINNNFRNIRNSLTDNLDCRFRKEIEFSVGPAGIMFASSFVSFTDTGFDLEEMLDQISNVQIGIYEPLDFESGTVSFNFLKNITYDLRSCGWKSLVKSKSGNELTGIYIKQDEEENPESLFVIAFSPEKLIMVEVNGNLKKLVETIAEEDEFRFDINY